MKILDIITEKESGLVIGKLRIIQLIEANLQLLIWVFIGSRNQNLLEIDSQISKYNYSLRKNYSIKLAILEKRLIYNKSMLSSQESIYNTTNLKSYYNQ